MKSIKRKHIPNHSKQKGLVIHCYKCKKYYSWTKKEYFNDEGKKVREQPTCGKDKVKFGHCKHPDRHKYYARIHVPGKSGVKIGKALDVQTYSEAVIETINFKDELINVNFNKNKTKENERETNQVVEKETNQAEKEIIQVEKEANQLKKETSQVEKESTQKNREEEKSNETTFISLFTYQLKYIDFLENIGVPIHQRVERSKKHKEEIQKCLILFNESLSLNGVDKKTIEVEEINDNHIGDFHKYLLENKNYSNRTYNNKMGYVSGFFKWYQENHKNIINPLDKVRSRSVKYQKDIITLDEFKNLLEKITPENGMDYRAKQPRNRYKPYLRDGIELALHTGGRREEITSMRWNMIKKIKNKPSFIEVPNYKVEKQLGDGFNDNVPPKIIPITKSLMKTLMRLGFTQYENSNNFILAPDRTGISDYAIMDNLSKGFSHFYNLLGTGRTLQLKSLRKTYLTFLNAALGGNTKGLSGHSSDEVLQKHYINESVINKAVSDLDFYV